MTTICVTGAHLAWDSRLVLGSTIDKLQCEKVVQRPGALFAFAGNTDLQAAVIAWWEGGFETELPHPYHQNDTPTWDCMRVTHGPDGIVCEQISAHMARPVRVGLPAAIGSGCDYALGALDAGLGAGGAVAVAAGRDIYTGGVCQVLDLAAYFHLGKISVTGFKL